MRWCSVSTPAWRPTALVRLFASPRLVAQTPVRIDQAHRHGRGGLDRLRAARSITWTAPSGLERGTHSRVDEIGLAATVRSANILATDDQESTGRSPLAARRVAAGQRVEHTRSGRLSTSSLMRA